MREHLNEAAPRRMAVLDPLKVTIENYGTDGEIMQSENMPQDKDNTDTRDMPFSREIFIERTDFMENPPGKFFRLAPGKEVRLKNAYIIKCEQVIKDADGNAIELVCSYDPDSKTGGATAGRKVKGTLHWVDAQTAVPCTVRLYDYLLTEDGDGDYMQRLNPDSVQVLDGALIEQAGATAQIGDKFQFMRQGYFCVDKDSGESLVFNRIVSLKDSFSRTLNKK